MIQQYDNDIVRRHKKQERQLIYVCYTNTNGIDSGWFHKFSLN